jgi:acyl-CoA thioesterase-1
MNCSLKKSIKNLVCLLLIVLSSSGFADQQMKIILFGDSLMAGYGLTQNENLATTLKAKFEQDKQNVAIINASVSGNTSSNGLARIDWSLEDKPNVVVLCLGANDMLRGINPQHTKENLSALITTIKQSGVVVVFAGMRAPISMGEEYQSQFDQLYPDLAKEHDLIFMPFLLEDVALEEKHLQRDYKHPNALGVEIIADNLYPYLLEGVAILQETH